MIRGVLTTLALLLLPFIAAFGAVIAISWLITGGALLWWVP